MTRSNFSRGVSEQAKRQFPKDGVRGVARSSAMQVRIPLATLAKIVDYLKNCSIVPAVVCINGLTVTWCPGFTGYFQAKHQELLWLSPTTRQWASKKQKLVSLTSILCNNKQPEMSLIITIPFFEVSDANWHAHLQRLVEGLNIS